MNHVRQRISCILLALCVFCTIGPAAAFADDPVERDYSDNFELFVFAEEENASETVDGDLDSDRGGAYILVEGEASGSAVINGDINAVRIGAEIDAMLLVGEASLTAEDINVSGRFGVAVYSVCSEVTVNTDDINVTGRVEGDESPFIEGIYISCEGGKDTLDTGNITVTADTAQEDGPVLPTAIDVEAKDYAGKEGDVQITAGDISSEGDGIDVKSAEEAEVKIQAGNVTAAETGLEIRTGSEKEEEEEKETVCTSGEAEIHTGDISAGGDGIDVKSTGGSSDTKVVAGKVSSQDTGTGADGDASASAVNAMSDGGTVSITLDQASASAKTTEKDGFAYASGVCADAGNPEMNSNVDISVTGDVKVSAQSEAGAAEATAVMAAATGSGDKARVRVDGNVSAETSLAADDVMQFGTRGVSANSMSGGEIEVTVEGSVTAKTDDAYAEATAVEALSEGSGSTTKVTVGGGTEGTVSVSAGNGGNAAVTVKDGGITAGTVAADVFAHAAEAAVSVTGDITAGDTENRPGNAYGVCLGADESGQAEVTVNGNISAVAEKDKDNGFAVGLGISNESGTVNFTASGDIRADGADNSYGIAVGGSEDQRTDIVVDGTVSGRDAAVVLVTPETKIGENVTLTVWELVPDENGAVVARGDFGDSTGDGITALNGENAALAEDEAAEKAVQYIIRVRTGQENVISTDGTTLYKNYNIAREGDRVTLKLNIPDGYFISAAYGDAGQNAALVKDENGNYYLTVPRGGAVELSVKMEKIPAPVRDETDGMPEPEKEGEMTGGVKWLRLGTSAFRIRVPESFAEGEKTEEDIREGMVGYYSSPDTAMDFDVYQISKEGLPGDMNEYAAGDAEKNGGRELKTGLEINSIAAASYRAKQAYAGQEYETLTYIIDGGAEYIKIVFWLDGASAEAEAEEIVSSLGFILRD